MSALARTFVLHTAAHAQSLVAFIKANAGAMVDAGTPLEVRVFVHKAKGSDAQRGLLWRINQQIADQAWVAGQRFDADVWHEHAKRELLPEETAAGVKKWRALPNGARELFMSTEDLNVAEKSAYIDALIAWAATELGVTVAAETQAA